MFIEICLLSSKAVTDREAVLAARYQAISALYKQFNRPESSTSNDTMASVVKLVINDLCFGETQETKVHFDGLREMTRARGGLQFLGRDGVLAKTIIIVDRVTAIALEASPNYPQEDVSEFAESLTPVPASVLTSTQSYLEEPTSAILRDMTFLIDSVVDLPRDPSPWEMEKVISVSEWVHNRLFGVAEGSSTAASPLHTSIRLASLMYCEAIQSRRPFSTTVNEQQILDLVGAVWEVPLETWNVMLATLLWTLIPLLPTAKTMPQCYSTKMMMMAAAVQLSMNDFEKAAKTLDTAVKLQEWLRTGQE